MDCGLPDPYNGDGDGIGSCECPRCEWCGAAPLECSCESDDDYLPDWPDDVIVEQPVATVRTVLDEPTYDEIAAKKRRDDV